MVLEQLEWKAMAMIEKPWWPHGLHHKKLHNHGFANKEVADRQCRVVQNELSS
jgi:hypothetical protein